MAVTKAAVVDADGARARRGTKGYFKVHTPRPRGRPSSARRVAGGPLAPALPPAPDPRARPEPPNGTQRMQILLNAEQTRCMDGADLEPARRGGDAWIGWQWRLPGYGVPCRCGAAGIGA